MIERSRLVAVCAALSLVAAQATAQSFFRHPQPGDIYREYSRTMNAYADWRVTDPNAGNARAQANLPNAILGIDIEDLDGAVRAEALIDLWQGHAGTTGKAIRFNGNGWIPISDLVTPPTSGECYLGQYNIVVDIPLAHLVSGYNEFEGTNIGQTCYDFSWGQHGMMGIVIRVYYGATKPHPTGSITAPGVGETITVNPTVTATASGPAAIRQVDFIAYYEGLDADGDGIYRDWHYYYHRASDETAMQIRGHVGTATAAPYAVTWNTSLVPDQPAGSIKLLARIQDVNGMWFVTNEVAGLTLQRTGTIVRLYKATDVPERFSARLGREERTCYFTIPSTDTVANATAATMLVSTFNGIDGNASIGTTFYTRVNSWTAPKYGANHYYSLDYITVPPSALVSGTNTHTFFCDDSSTGIWINWPGPQMVVTYSGNFAPPPVAPALVSPPDNSTGNATSPTLRWRSSAGATSYRVQVALDSGFSSVVFDDSTVTDTTKALQGLNFETRYYWRVRARSAAGASAYSASWSFSTNAGAPTLVAPADGQTNQAVPALLQWRAQSGALAFWLHVSTDSLFGGTLTLNDSTVLDTFRTVSGLQSGQTYYWRVRTRTVSGPGVFSSAWSFTTSLPLPDAVSLVSPADQQIVSAESVLFAWQKGEPAVTRYWLEIGSDPLFQFKFVDSSLTDTSKVVGGLVSNILYSWRIRAWNISGWGPYSSARQFTPLYTGINPQAEVPTEYSLSQNYPNPFNPTTQVAFALPRDAKVKLEIFNVLGEHIMTVLDGPRAAGYHEVTVDAGLLPAGVYLYRLSTDDRVMTKKMVLVK